jgi:hypothetical protein
LSHLSNYSERERESYSIFEKFYECELEWAELRVMNENEFTKIQYSLASLEGQIALLKSRQPNCRELLERYDSEFSKYSAEVDRILQVNNHERYQLIGYLFSKEKIETLKNTLGTLREIRNKNWRLLDERTIEYSHRILWTLTTLGKEVETDKSEFFRSLEKIRETLEKNNSILIDLLRPIHDWVVLESPKRKRCARCSEEILLEETENGVPPPKEMKPVRDPDGYLPTPAPL